MKEELQGKLVEILTSIQSAAGKASDFAMEQLPDIAQSYVAYGRAASVAYMLTAIGFGLFAWWCARKLAKAVEDDNPAIGVPVGFAGILAAFAAPAIFLSNINSSLLVWFAPKVWLLKEIASLVK